MRKHKGVGKRGYKLNMIIIYLVGIGRQMILIVHVGAPPRICSWTPNLFPSWFQARY